MVFHGGNRGVEIARDRFNQIDYAFQRGRLVAMVQKWHVGHVVPEANAMGEPVIEELMRDPAMNGVTIAPFQDIANLAADARMNVPGQAEGNWNWRIPRDEAFAASIDVSFAALRTLTQEASRSDPGRQT